MKQVPFGRDQIEEVAKEYGTPFYLYDEESIQKAVKGLQEAFAWNKGFREYFAVKALPNPVIMKLLHEAGCGMDCSSRTELMLCRAVQISGQDIMFSSNDTPPAEYELAREMGAYVNLDDISHIPFLAEHGGIPETVCCRYNPGGSFVIGNTIMGNPGEAKYGFTRVQLSRGLRMLRDMGARQFGIHAFLASNTTNDDYYPTLARHLFQTAAELSEEVKMPIAFINLSGGIGIPYRPFEKEVDIRYVGDEVQKVYHRIIESAGHQVPLFTELGRYITGPSGYLVSRVLHLKETYKKYVGLDACACNLMRPALYGAYHHITVMGKEDQPLTSVYDVTGGLCENNDKFAIDRAMPRVDRGDLIVIHDVGAHGFSMGYNYNGKLRSAEVLLRGNGEAELIRRAETPADYFSTLDFLHII